MTTANLPALSTGCSPDVLHFCARLGIMQYLSVAVALAQKCFPLTQELKLQPEEDPETGEEWLRLDVVIQGEIDKGLNNYDSYTDLWVASVPWPARDKIRLSYTIL